MDQLFASVGYQVESYGKYHLPFRWKENSEGTGLAVQYDGYALDFTILVTRGVEGRVGYKPLPGSTGILGIQGGFIQDLQTNAANKHGVKLAIHALPFR